MTRQEFMQKLNALSPEQFERLLPHLEADLAASDRLIELKQQIELGRHSAATEPLQDATEVYSRVRESLP